MDATMFNEGRGIWHVAASPSMRDLGDLVQGEDGTVVIEPDAGSDLQGMPCGPYATMEEAMAAIGTHLGGQCRHAPKRRRL